MNNNCEYAKAGGSCLCDACQSIREALKEAEKISMEEIDELFLEAEKMMKGCGENKQNK